MCRRSTEFVNKKHDIELYLIVNIVFSCVWARLGTRGNVSGPRAQVSPPPRTPNSDAAVIAGWIICQMRTRFLASPTRSNA